VDPLLAFLEEMHKDNIRFVHRYFPLVSIHDKAFIAAEAAEAAGAQGAFWEMHDLLFERAPEWSGLAPEQMPSTLTGYAQELGLDTERFSQDLTDHVYQQKVQDSYDSASSLGIGGTPTFIVNGYRYPGGEGSPSLPDFIELVLLEPKKFQAAPPQVIDPDKQYTATIRTAKGDIVIELYADKAPVTVNSVVYLAQQGWYDGVPFHRVIPGFVAQGGDPSGSGLGSPGYRCSDEIYPKLKYDGPGVVGMASGGPGTSSVGSQFFITYDAQPTLDGNYTIIGKVIEGMDVVERLTPRDPSQEAAPPPGDIIETIIIEEK
jgi:cyclophilin family peptidyl-prolyl cis-trans isomerase